jgi:hypothetical protein
MKIVPRIFLAMVLFTAAARSQDAGDDRKLLEVLTVLALKGSALRQEGPCCLPGLIRSVGSQTWPS